VQPVERELRAFPRKVMLGSFAFATAAAFYGLFSLETNSLFGVVYPKGTVPLLVTIALACGVMALVLGIGMECCSRCRQPLSHSALRFAATDAARVSTAVRASAAADLPEAGASAEAEHVCVDLDWCENCRAVATLKVTHLASATGSHRSSDELVSKQTIVGSAVEGFIARSLKRRDDS
jgi:hypothetical protein